MPFIFSRRNWTLLSSFFLCNFLLCANRVAEPPVVGTDYFRGFSQIFAAGAEMLSSAAVSMNFVLCPYVCPYLLAFSTHFIILLWAENLMYEKVLIFVSFLFFVIFYLNWILCYLVEPSRCYILLQDFFFILLQLHIHLQQSIAFYPCFNKNFDAVLWTIGSCVIRFCSWIRLEFQ